MGTEAAAANEAFSADLQRDLQRDPEAGKQVRIFCCSVCGSCCLAFIMLAWSVHGLIMYFGDVKDECKTPARYFMYYLCYCFGSAIFANVLTKCCTRSPKEPDRETAEE